MEEKLKAMGFEEVEPEEESRVFIRGGVRVSVTRLEGVERLPQFYHAGFVGEDGYTFIYQPIPDDMTIVESMVKTLEARGERKEGMGRLKPCPFCGSSTVNAWRVMPDYNFAVVCPGCKTQGPQGETRGEAAFGWNNRPQAPEHNPANRVP